MVDDLLDLAKVEAGRVEISPAWFEMVDLFSALRGMFKPVLTNPAVNLVFEEPQDVPKLYTDDRKLSQILRNFISNALKFTPKGEVRVGARLDGDSMVTFSVADSGIGIAPEFHELHLRGLLAGAVAAAEAPARHRPGPVPEQEAGAAAGGQRRICRANRARARCSRHDPGATGGRQGGMIDPEVINPPSTARSTPCWWSTTTPPRAIPPGG
jgi:hypothetical protein